MIDLLRWLEKNKLWLIHDPYSGLWMVARPDSGTGYVSFVVIDSNIDALATGVTAVEALQKAVERESHNAGKTDP